jgi:thiol-disulfide isomerase/thioredoxin
MTFAAALLGLLLGQSLAGGGLAAPERAPVTAPGLAPGSDRRVVQAQRSPPAAASLEVRPGTELAKLVAELGAGRPLVLHFWATWCAACRDEFPRLRPLLLGLDKRGVAAALVSIDDPTTRAGAPAMLDRYRLRKLRSLVLDAPDPAPVAAALGERQWDGSLPATFVFDRHGAKVKAFLGPADPGMLDAAVDAAQRVR